MTDCIGKSTVFQLVISLKALSKYSLQKKKKVINILVYQNLWPQLL